MQPRASILNQTVSPPCRQIGCMLSCNATCELDAGKFEVTPLASPASVAPILDKDTKRAHIEQIESVLDDVSAGCFHKCASMCEGVTQKVNLAGKIVFQSYSHEDCMRNCSTGCKFFKDGLAYRG